MITKKIEFILPAEVVAGATAGILLGEFNDWDSNKGVALKKQKDGSLKASLSLGTGSYEYRYLLNDGRWVNDLQATRFAYIPQFTIENCVIEIADEAAKVDDLTKIEGIGKKIAELLNADGISTFEALSKTSTVTLQAILDKAGKKFNIHDPQTWAKQAKLAATGDWVKLKKLQDELNGGKTK